ncbi:S8 family peptidase [Massilia endophytica]|uniref:S8 family peptidase n=1 Tax=Massilia endophytica TaxID=2899220 RepID=UPI001E4E448D|nr:S8 family peptidase [Massilia endophytica]UGQ46383.1 S8 family peptidase [Massilia endophytica]
MATGPQRLPHLRLVNRFVTQDYTPRPGRGPTLHLMQRERAQHGNRILGQLENLRPVLEERKLSRQALNIDAPDGIAVEFRSAAGFDLVFESLDVIRSGIELLNVREQGEVTFATCWIPDGKLDILVRKVVAYLQENTRSEVPRPRNANLVESIEEIGVATMTQLWTDEEAMPDGDGEHWWEIWLRTDKLAPAATFLRFKNAATAAHIEIAEQWLAFHERVVTNIKATQAQLAQSIPILNLVAEIRRADRPPLFPHTLTLGDQDNIVANIAGRIDIRGDDVSVAILDTGVARAHPLIAPVLAEGDMHAVNNAWGVADHEGHGTRMAGVVLYGDLRDAVEAGGRISVPFRLESSKILPPSGMQVDGNDSHEVLGAITEQAVYKCEIDAPNRRRVICKAVTSAMHQIGEPSSYSAAIDQLAFDAEGGDGRLFIISAGNVQPDQRWLAYPLSNKEYGVEQPGQAWNALTIGAYTDKTTLPASDDFAGWSTLAAAGDLSPFSSTSQEWRGWPMKPDVVFEGGNVAVDPAGELTDIPPSLQLLTTNRNFNVHPLSYFWATSAATAQGAGVAGRIWAENPDLWPESVRGLIVHHANWTEAQRARYPNWRDLLRACGHGVPDETRAKHSAQHRVCLIAQETLQPFRLDQSVGKMNELCIFQLPWPQQMLLDMQDTRVKMRVTLSYFVEPSPGKRGWTNRYRYASHSLRFDVKRTTETEDMFNKRVNYAMRDDSETIDVAGDTGWDLGPRLRGHGSLHADCWRGPAADLATKNLIAVYPVVGWWRQRLNRGRCTTPARFSLLVSLESEDVTVQLYNAIAQELEVPIDLELG